MEAVVRAAEEPEAFMEIRDKSVIITGASEGIGAACARLLTERGARLVLTARSEPKLRQVAGPGAVVVPGDLTEPETRKRVVEAALNQYGRIDILINNAGVGLAEAAWRAPLDLVRRMMELNFFAALGMVQLVVPHMIGQRSGMIVNVSSIAGKVVFPWITPYCASKYALCALSDGLRMELKHWGVRVLTVCPGYVTTGFHEHVLAGEVPAAVRRARSFPISAEQCAQAIIRGIEKEKRTVVVPWLGWLLIGFARLFPRALEAKFAQLYGEHQPSRPEPVAQQRSHDPQA